MASCFSVGKVKRNTYLGLTSSGYLPVVAYCMESESTQNVKIHNLNIITPYP